MRPRGLRDSARRTRPTRQWARVIIRLAMGSFLPTTFGTLHFGGGGGGGGCAVPTVKLPFMKLACGSQTNL
jgi:hypothetical protein